MVADHVSAVLTPWSFYASESEPILANAGIAMVCNDVLGPTELTISNSFPLSGIIGDYYGAPALLAKAGARKIAVLGVSGIPVSTFAEQLMHQAAQSAGIDVVNTVNVDLTTTDYTAAATQVLSGGVQGVALAVAPTQELKAIAALRTAGFKGPITTDIDSLGQATLTALGSQANGVLATSPVASPTDTSNPSVVQFQADMNKYAPGAVQDDTALQGWSSVQLFVAVTKNLSNWDAKSVLDAFNNMPKIDLPSIDGYQVAGVTSPLPQYPRLFHPETATFSIENGKVVPNGFINPFQVLASVKSSS
jgi:ABC-type branched-subunit amino acid transport system substrate-binding protein